MRLIVVWYQLLCITNLLQPMGWRNRGYQADRMDVIGARTVLFRRDRTSYKSTSVTTQ
jgi:hypothetical protein